MTDKNETIYLVLKGLGRKPTRYLLRWSPTLKDLFRFDLLEVMRCEADGGIVTPKRAQSSRAVEHLGHRLKSPGYFSFFEFLKVQLRLIK